MQIKKFKMMNEQISINAPVYECSYSRQKAKNTEYKILFSSSKSRAYDSQCNGIYEYSKSNHAVSGFQCQIKKIHSHLPSCSLLFLLHMRPLHIIITNAITLISDREINISHLFGDK